MKKKVLLFVILISVVCLLVIRDYHMNSISANIKQVEKDTVEYLIKIKGYSQTDFSLKESGYDRIMYNVKEYYVKVTFNDEPNEWYLYAYNDSNEILQMGYSESGKHTEVF